MGRHHFVNWVGVLALLGILFTGCGTKARTEKGFDERLVDAIVRGKTTKKEIVKNFGYPHEVIGSPDSVEYLYRSKGKGETLLVVFKDDVVVDYKLTTEALPEIKPALSKGEGPAPRPQEARSRNPVQDLPQERAPKPVPSKAEGLEATKRQEAAPAGEPFIKRFQSPPAKPAPAEAAPARAIAAATTPAQAAPGGDSQVITLSLRDFDPNALPDLVEIQRRHKRSFVLEVIGSANATQVQVRFEPQAVESVKELLDYLARPRQEGP